jgi:hypothetical protein
VLAVGFVATKSAQAVPLFPDVTNTFSGIAIVEDAGYNGAPAGSQAALFGFAGSEVSIDDQGTVSTLDDLVNLPQAAPVIDTDGDSDVDSDDIALAPPAMVIFETDTVTDGSSISFGQELTAVIGGLWPTALTIDTGTSADLDIAPGSTAGDLRPDQLARGVAPATPVAKFTVHFGPGALVGGVPGYPYPDAPVFEIYDDVPPLADLDISSITRTIVETEADFDGAIDAAPRFPASPLAGLIGATEPPPTAAPSQFSAGGANMAAATDGSLFMAGWIDSATATYTFFDPNVNGYIPGDIDANQIGYAYRLELFATGVVTDGYMLAYSRAINPGGAYDGSDIGISFSATVFGFAYSGRSNPGGGFVLGVDPFASWDVDLNKGNNAGNASFTILPTIPEPGTMALLGLALVPLALRRKK